MLKPRGLTLMGLILAAALSRLVPHPPNFTPIVAMALFGGANFTDKRHAFLVTFAAIILSDFFLGFHSQLLATYGCYVLIVAIGIWLRKNKGILPLLTATLGSSVLFFVVTNFGVWAIDTLYPRTPEGLAACYAAAIPFFRNTITGDFLYTLTLFGAFKLAESRFVMLRETPLSIAR